MIKWQPVFNLLSSFGQNFYLSAHCSSKKQENHFLNIELNNLTTIFIDRVVADLLDGNYYLQGTKCCNYGADGKKLVSASAGYDCILIPGASLAGAIKPNKICGNNMGIITAAGETNATLCCKFVIV